MAQNCSKIGRKEGLPYRYLGVTNTHLIWTFCVPILVEKEEEKRHIFSISAFMCTDHFVLQLDRLGFSGNYRTSQIWHATSWLKCNPGRVGW